MINNEMKALTQALLFSSGEPLEIARIAESLETEISVALKVLEELTAELESESSGLSLLRLDDSFQICTKRAYADKIREVLEIKRNTPLSAAAFEVLAVVAYNQPVTKSYVEQIRGVDCSGVISTLTQKGLIEEKGRLDLPGRPLLYGTTSEFLRCFCLTSLSDLPDLPEKDELKKDTENDEDTGVQLSFGSEEEKNQSDIEG